MSLVGNLLRDRTRENEASRNEKEALRTELREQAHAQFKALNEAATALGVPLIREEMGAHQKAVAAGFIALSAAAKAAKEREKCKP